MRLPKPTSNKPGIIRNEEGGVLILVGLAIVFLVGVGGAAIDLGTQQLMRVKLQNSADAAATSAASLITCKPNPINDTDRRNAAQRYFDLNYPKNFAGNTVRPTPVISVDGSYVSVSASDGVATHFVNNFAVPRLNTDGASKASVYDRYWDRSFDVVMLVDETGSMARGSNPDGSGAPREQAARNALNTFVRKLFPECIQNPNARMGLIGFAGFTTNLWGLTGDRATAITYTGKTRAVGYNTEEIGLRAATNMLFEEPGSPTGDPSWSIAAARKPWYEHKKPLHYADPWNDPTPMGSPVPTMDAPDWFEYGYRPTYTLAAYDGASNTSRGATAADELPTRNTIGRCLKDAQRPIYSAGRITDYECQSDASIVGWYGGYSWLPLKSAPYNDLSVDFDTRVPAPLIARTKTAEKKQIILLSDGSIATDSTTSGISGASRAAQVAPMLAECARARGKGATIYAVNFTSTNPDDEAALRECSDGNYYYAPDEATLRSILLEIMTTINRTRIVE